MPPNHVAFMSHGAYRQQMGSKSAGLGFFPARGWSAGSSHGFFPVRAIVDFAREPFLFSKIFGQHKLTKLKTSLD
jgi:hypothetical protein